MFVNIVPPKLVPIPFVITDGIETVKFPVELLDWVFVTLNAVSPLWLKPDGYKFHENTPVIKLPPEFT